MKKSLFTCLSLLLLFTAKAQDLSLFAKQQYVSGADTLRYRILYPAAYRPEKSYPLIVFLHGSGERGSDNEIQLIHGGKLFVREDIRNSHAAIVVFPQCPKDSAWSRFKRGPKINEWIYDATLTATTPALLVKKLMDSLIASGKADKKRVYIGGLSLGGMGTYDMLVRYPGYFAAAFPICGATDVNAFLAQAGPVPMWMFHGAEDAVVPPTFNRELHKGLMEKGARTVKYTEYPGVNHNSWDNAFAESNLLPWMMSKKKKKNPSW
ncbi:MAG: alpha/beta hydrolase-fold protein [Bacteroidota bacterium]